MDHKDLYKRSIEIIEEHQSVYGSYIASPNFETYAYSWLRDGSYIAVAMDHVGKHDSSIAFHHWVNRVVKRYRKKIGKIRKALMVGRKFEDQDFLFTRYSMAGLEDMTDESWGNFQYDGYGAWLWALGEYYRLTLDRTLIQEVWQSVCDITEYLTLVWRLPCYDCWEEHPELLHTYSLACVFGGLNASMKLAKVCNLPIDNEKLDLEIGEIKVFVLENGVFDGYFVKHINLDLIEKLNGDISVDSSLLGIITPYGLVEPESEISKRTLEKIRNELVSRLGGVYRYCKDKYYGGGTWILLTAWLGWVETMQGEFDFAQKRLDWIASKAEKNGWLPEQLLDDVLHHDMKQPWIEKWGQVASPLLWSHAMYLILYEALKKQMAGDQDD